MGRGVHLEVESRFELEPNATASDVRAWLDVKAVREIRAAGTVRMATTYYDTPDLDLLRRGAVLRRRTGGSDAGWHLLLPVGRGRPVGRPEVSCPVGRSTPVPPELTSLIRALLRDGTPRPVVRMRTTRTLTRLLDADGAVLAELADDAVTAEVLGEESTSAWREIEVGLVDGGPRLLAAVGRRLRRHGATPSARGSKLTRVLDGRLPSPPVPNGHRGARHGTSAGDVVVAHLRAQREELLACDPQVRLDTEDAVHRMRVATRRLRAALATFRPLFVAGPATVLRNELSWLTGVLGVARDAEGLRDLLAAELARTPDHLRLGPVAERIRTELDEAYQKAHQEVVAELDADRYLALLAALDGFVDDPPFTRIARLPADRQIPPLVRRAVRRVKRELRAAAAEPGPEQRERRSHEVRKAARRARDAAEAIAPLLGSPADELAKQLRAVQQALGPRRDGLQAREWLRAAAERAHAAGEPTFTYGLLYARQVDGGTDADLAGATRLLATSTRRRLARGARR